MAKERILLIEDDEDIQELIRYNLAREGYDVEATITAEEGLHRAVSWCPDLILLDLMLPGMDGLDACRRLKARDTTAPVPIVMVTAKGEESDIVTGLELGADDYIVKPFSPKVLVARIRSVLRRYTDTAKVESESPVKLHGLVIHPGRREVKLNGNPIDLTFTEFNLIHFLALRPGWVFTRTQIVNAVKGEDYYVTDRTIDVHILSLRRKLGDKVDLIETIRGVGYRFRE
ncbi:MAG: response regulator [bacterium]